MARIDDVTIEKVLVNKQELDNSLFEYEQSKQRNKFIRSQLGEPILCRRIAQTIAVNVVNNQIQIKLFRTFISF